MPWCPICKNEYREGFTECSECHAALVEHLDSSNIKAIIPILYGMEDALKDIQACLIANSITDPKVMYDAESSAYKLMILEEEHDRSKRIISAYMQEYAKKSGAADEQVKKKSLNQKLQAQYIDPSAKAKENHSTGISLIAFGSVGILVLVLLWLGIIPSNFNELMRILGTFIMGGFFLILIISGFLAIKSSKELISQDSLDKKKENEIIEWCKTHLSEQDRVKMTTMFSNSDDSKNADELTENSLFFARSEYIVQRIMTAFPDCETELAEHICEIVFDQIFEGQKA